MQNTITAAMHTREYQVRHISRHLDRHWGNWRDGCPNADYALVPHPLGGSPWMVTVTDEGPGWLDLDGVLFYSEEWL
jgi:hypothetical protein